MTCNAVHESQIKAARFAGALYLAMMALEAFAEFGVRSRLVVYANAAETARNIVASDGLFRVGIACDLVACAGNIALVAALYVLLKPVNQPLAILAAFWRLAECVICGAITLNRVMVVQLLSGTDYLRVFSTDQRQALAALFVSEQSAGYRISLVFFALGSTIFSYFFSSRVTSRARWRHGECFRRCWCWSRCLR